VIFYSTCAAAVDSNRGHRRLQGKNLGCDCIGPSERNKMLQENIRLFFLHNGRKVHDYCMTTNKNYLEWLTNMKSPQSCPPVWVLQLNGCTIIRLLDAVDERFSVQYRLNMVMETLQLHTM